jgi:hypothetical protein
MAQLRRPPAAAFPHPGSGSWPESRADSPSGSATGATSLAWAGSARRVGGGGDGGCRNRNGLRRSRGRDFRRRNRRRCDWDRWWRFPRRSDRHRRRHRDLGRGEGNIRHPASPATATTLRTEQRIPGGQHPGEVAPEGDQEQHRHQEMQHHREQQARRPRASRSGGKGEGVTRRQVDLVIASVTREARRFQGTPRRSSPRTPGSSNI